MRLLTLGLLLLVLTGLKAQTSYRIYRALEGERPAEIASRFRIPLQDLLKANPGIVADQPLQQGEVLLVPLQPSPSSKVSQSPTANAKPILKKTTPPSSPSTSPLARAYWIYTVEPGDTLEGIAQRFGTTVRALVLANNLSPQATLLPGQVLVVPVLEQPISSPSQQPTSSGPNKQTRSVANQANQRVRYQPPPLPAPRIFGYVGTVISSIVRIRSAPRSNAPVWSQVSRGTQLIITTERPGWFGVLMINGATGWVTKEAVRKDNRAIFWDDLLQVFGGTGGQDRSVLVAEAMRYLGVPYRYGGTSPLRGLDCSAFVQRVFASRGIRLPRTAAEQAKIGIPVPLSQLRPGDRLYFAVKGNRIDHCGIYLGNGLFIHASGRHDAVVISSLSEPLYARSLVAIRR